MLVTVAGLERTALHRDPNGVECDTCGRRLIWDRKDYAAEVASLREAGWTIPNRYDQVALCPAHAATGAGPE